MRLERARIMNFRSVNDVTIEFHPRCRVLVGINESGKSSILNALALLDPERKPRVDDVRDIRPDEDADQDAYVQFVFVLDQEERERAFARFAADVAGDLNAPLVTVDGTPQTLAEYFGSRSTLAEWVSIPSGQRNRGALGLDDDERCEVHPAWMAPRPGLGGGVTVDDLSGNPRPLIELKLVHASAVQDLPEDDLVPIDIDDLNSAIDAVSWEIANDAIPGCVFWSYSNEHLLPAQVGVAEFAADPDVCMPLRHMFALAGYDDPSAAIAQASKRPNGMRNLLDRVSTITTDHMQRVWPDYAGIRISLAQNGENIDAYVADTFNAYDVARRSDGFKRFVSFLLLVSARVKSADLTNVLYLHDEPDVSLHPSGARFLRDELIAIAANNYVVYSTHSPYMIDRDNIGRHLIVRKDSEVTTASAVDAASIADDEVIYNALGTSLFEVLKPDNIIFEGWRDKRLFEVAVSQPPEARTELQSWASQIGRCHAKGVKDVGRIAPMLELANRNFVILSDGDQPAREHQRQYDGYGKWIRYDELLPGSGVVTAEDFIDPAAIVAAIETVDVAHPIDGKLAVADIPVDGGRLAYIDKWLEQRGVSRDDRKKRLNEVKTALFGSLSSSQIDARYFAALQALREQL